MNDAQQEWRLGLGIVIVLVFASNPVSAAPVPAETLAIWSTSSSAWSMWKLEVLEEGVALPVQLMHGRSVCPMAWGFSLLTGSPEDFRTVAGAYFDYHHGRAGYQVETSGDLPAVQAHDMTEGTERECDPASMLFNFRPPVGVSYLLGFHAGAQIDGTAIVSAAEGSVRVLGASHGNGSTYIRQDQFEGSAWVHVAAPGPDGSRGPASAAWPDATHVSDGHAAASFVLERRASLTFEHHPLLLFATMTNGAQALRVVDPAGKEHRNGETSLTLGAESIRMSNPMTGWMQFRDNALSGTYELHAEWAANAAPRSGGAGAYAWGIDFWFPEEADA